MPQFNVGNRVRCIRQHRWGNLGEEGEVIDNHIADSPRIRWDRAVEYYIGIADLEPVDDEDGPEQEAEWMTLTSYVIFYVSDHAIADGHVDEEVSSVCFPTQECAEEEVGWFTRNQYKVLATKKLTTRVPRP